MSQESNTSSVTSDGDPTRMGRRRKRKKIILEFIPETNIDTLSFASSTQQPAAAADHIVSTIKAKEDRL